MVLNTQSYMWDGIGIGYLLGPTLRAPYGANNGATFRCDYNTTTLTNKPCDTLIEKNTFECIYNLGDLYKKLSGWARLSPTATPSTGIGCIIIKAALSFVHFVINENHDFK